MREMKDVLPGEVPDTQGPEVLPGAIAIEVDGIGFLGDDGADAVMAMITIKVAMRATDLLDDSHDEHEPCPTIGIKAVDTYHLVRESLIEQLRARPH